MATNKKHAAHVDLTIHTGHFARLATRPKYAELAKRLVSRAVGGPVAAAKLAGPASDADKVNAQIARWRPKPDDRDAAGRAEHRCNELLALLPSMHPHCYVDFGCGDATITALMGKKIGASRIVGVDIYNAGRPGVEHLASLTDLAPSSVDFLTAFVSLHHTEVAVEIPRIAEVLAPGGIVAIREHDDDPADPLFYDYLQCVHIVAAMWDESGDLAATLRTANYWPHSAFNEMFTTAGLRPLGHWPLKPNPQRLFYAAWQKTTLE